MELINLKKESKISEVDDRIWAKAFLAKDRIYTVRKISRFSELRGATPLDLDPRSGFTPKNCEKSLKFGSIST